MSSQQRCWVLGRRNIMGLITSVLMLMQSADARVLRAERLYEMGRYELALNALGEHCSGAAADVAQCEFLRGLILLELQEVKEAETAFLRVFAADPRFREQRAQAAEVRELLDRARRLAGNVGELRLAPLRQDPISTRWLLQTSTPVEAALQSLHAHVVWPGTRSFTAVPLKDMGGSWGAEVAKEVAPGDLSYFLVAVIKGGVEARNGSAQAPLTTQVVAALQAAASATPGPRTEVLSVPPAAPPQSIRMDDVSAAAPTRTQPAPAASSDSTPPLLEHTPCRSHRAGVGSRIEARISDVSAVFEPTVFWRLGGAGGWQRLPMHADNAAGVFVAPVNVGSRQAALEYFIEVFDEYGNGPSRSGSPQAPHVSHPASEVTPCEQYARQAPAPFSYYGRVQPSAAILVDAPQTNYLAPLGGGVSTRVGVRVEGPWLPADLGCELQASWVGFGSNAGGEPATATIVSAGVQATPKWGLDGVEPYVDAHLGVARTGLLTRFASDASVGVDFETELAWWGPFVRYVQIFDQAGRRSVSGDAQFVMAGLSARVAPGPAAPQQVTSSFVSGVDADGDTIPSPADMCPGVAEDRDGFQDFDGCIDPDNDGDSVPDVSDRCPTEAEDMDSFEDDDGCPELDNDRDGVADTSDRCPETRETYNGVDDADGCADATRSSAYVNFEEQKITITERVYFATNSHELRSRSHDVLDDVALILEAYPQIRRVRVEGHSDHVGPLDFNMKLSTDRAYSVMAYLIKQGIDPRRLEAAGYGPTRPLVPSEVAEARDVNRRVEFTIIEADAIMATVEATVLEPDGVVVK